MRGQAVSKWLLENTRRVLLLETIFYKSFLRWPKLAAEPKIRLDEPARSRSYQTSKMSAARKLLVDIHTHVYLPRYAALLRSRNSVPYIKSISPTDERLLILDHEPSGGRPVNSQYWDREGMIAMFLWYWHNLIDHQRRSNSWIHTASMYRWSGNWLPVLAQYSILTPLQLSSSANPWLDFLPASQAWDLVLQLNNDLERYCSASPTVARAQSPLKRLYGFGLLPLVPEIPTLALLESVYQIASLPHLRGLIMGTRGIGKGLDDQALDPVWAAIEKAGLVVFIHPHYGVGAQAWGENDNGHVLPLALGFPFETTTVSLFITVFV